MPVALHYQRPVDCAVDTTTPAGEAMASVLCHLAQFERRLIGQRTREALAAMRAQGVTPGRPRVVPQRVVERIVRERKAGRSLAAIADSLNADGVATRWAGGSEGGASRSSTAAPLAAPPDGQLEGTGSRG
jgi:DNA invertase Pin-like site-specific DNA recombinase